MADAIGTYSNKLVSFSFNTTSDGLLQENYSYEGEAEGFGAIFGTLIITHALAEAGEPSGVATYVGKSISDDNSMIGGIGEGTWEQVGNEPRFNVSLVIELSNGTKLRSVGVADTETRPLNGHNYAVE